MPYLKSVCIHATVKRSLAYILDPTKTEGIYLVSRNCMTNPNDAYKMMKMVYEQFSGKKFDEPIPKEGKARVKAIHYIQSFDPADNVSPEKAFAIAKAFVREAFGMDCQSVIVTHTDKEHIHNHIIINSYGINGKKFYDNKQTLRKLRQISDEVCLRYGIKPYNKSKGREQTIPYNEWQHRKNKTSWKQLIREKIDELIPLVQSIDELLCRLKEDGFEVKRGKYISIKAPGQERFVRTKTLGLDYTEESIATRIRFGFIEGGFSIAAYDTSELYRAYAEITHGVYQLNSSETDNIHHLAAQLSVINEEKVTSIGDLQGRLHRLSDETERVQKEIEHVLSLQGMLKDLIHQSEMYFKYSDLQDPTEYEKEILEICRGSMDTNDIHTVADVDKLRERYERNEKYLSQLTEKQSQIQNKQNVYSDIAATYEDISKGDYISRLVEQQKRKEQKNNKRKPRR